MNLTRTQVEYLVSQLDELRVLTRRRKNVVAAYQKMRMTNIQLGIFFGSLVLSLLADMGIDWYLKPQAYQWPTIIRMNILIVAVSVVVFGIGGVILATIKVKPRLARQVDNPKTVIGQTYIKSTKRMRNTYFDIAGRAELLNVPIEGLSNESLQNMIDPENVDYQEPAKDEFFEAAIKEFGDLSK